ncbi:MAG: cupin domain-containing protein [Pseudomonadota bacterium]
MKNNDALPDELMSELLKNTASLEPTPESRRSILARVKDRINHDQLPLQELVTVPAGGDWIEPYPGNKIKMLRDDSDTQSFLVELAPGTRFPPHSHPKDEETLVLEGEVLFGEIPLKKGDYHLARAGTDHDETFSEKGCLLFIRCGTEQNQ